MTCHNPRDSLPFRPQWLRMPESGGSSARGLYLASALMLFLELTLIRWLGESILYLSFFTNFVLLASFLGIGIGFLAHGRQDWFRHLR
jgi:hypothetical protein